MKQGEAGPEAWGLAVCPRPRLAARSWNHRVPARPSRRGPRCALGPEGKGSAWVTQEVSGQAGHSLLDNKDRLGFYEGHFSLVPALRS